MIKAQPSDAVPAPDSAASHSRAAAEKRGFTEFLHSTAPANRHAACSADAPYMRNPSAVNINTEPGLAAGIGPRFP